MSIGRLAASRSWLPGAPVVLLQLGFAAALLAATGARADELFLLGPPPGDGPVVVHVGFRLREVTEVDEVFAVVGFDESEVVLEPDPGASAHAAIGGVTVSQWDVPTVRTSARDYDFNVGGRNATVKAFVVGIEMARRPGFMVRLTFIPLTILVVISWSVFWMDRSSLGERMDISFLGILTIVAYQIMFSDLLPRISYPTFTYAFLTVSFVTMCSTVVVNLVVEYMDRHGKAGVGDRVDRGCRFAFPIAYFGSNVLIGCHFFLVP